MRPGFVSDSSAAWQKQGEVPLASRSRYDTSQPDSNDLVACRFWGVHALDEAGATAVRNHDI